MTKKEKFLQLVSNQKTETLARAKERKQNRAFIRRSQEIALAILDRLDSLNWSQRRLAEEMGVSPQLVNKWVRGGENFTLETLTNLEAILNTTLFIVPEQEQKFQADTMAIE